MKRVEAFCEGVLTELDQISYAFAISLVVIVLTASIRPIAVPIVYVKAAMIVGFRFIWGGIDMIVRA